MHWLLWILATIAIFYLLTIISVMVMFKSTSNMLDKNISNIVR